MLAQRALGSRGVYRQFLNCHVRPRDGERVIDVGCGPGDILSLMHGVDYLGLDVSERYIAAAGRRYGDRGRFVCLDCLDASIAELDELGRFDVVMAIGLMHHFDDAQASEVFALAARMLKSEGRLAILEPAIIDGQSRITRWFVSHDRGDDIRPPDRYRELAQSAFGTVRIRVYDQLARIPYTHVALEAREPRGA
jgi:2-polyprenyl-3-methyl-5-hydroxy-6-metoxy-1,4-benzoquinol methylase